MVEEGKKSGTFSISWSSLVFFLFMELLIEKKNYNSKKEDLEEEDQEPLARAFLK